MYRTILVWAAFSAWVGCSNPNQYQPPAPPSVTVAKPVVQTVTNFLEETGTTEAESRVEIRARVQGFLEKIYFQDGQEVKAGDELYLIQPLEFEAKVASAKAGWDASKVELRLAQIEFQRQENLLKDNATAAASVDQAKAHRDAAIAAVSAAKAALDQTQLNLDYTRVTTPISGRVERTLVKLGNLVGGIQPTHLTTVIGYDPIHVYFNISERALLKSMNKERRDTDTDKKKDITEISAGLRRAIDDDFLFEGHLDYADLGVDQSTGTYTIRAIFPNPNLDIFPGLFVRIRIPIGTTENAVLIPERSIGADQAGRYVMIIGDQNIAQRRNVELGAKFGDKVVVTEGLDGKETVVIDGIQRARPGVEVTPKETKLSPVKSAAVEKGNEAAGSD